jgi:hypothetical protein
LQQKVQAEAAALQQSVQQAGQAVDAQVQQINQAAAQPLMYPESVEQTPVLPKS